MLIVQEGSGAEAGINEVHEGDQSQGSSQENGTQVD